jgi:hypothetical protein
MRAVTTMAETTMAETTTDETTCCPFCREVGHAAAFATFQLHLTLGLL